MLNITRSKHPYEWMAGLYMFRHLTLSDLVKKVQNKCHSDLKKEYIQKLIEHDSGINTIMCIVMDPLTIRRMRLPSEVQLDVFTLL